MAAPSPATDPLWAYDTPGWTNQNATGDIEGNNLTPVSFEYLAEPAAASWYLARTMDPDLSAAAGTVTPSNAALNCLLVWVPAPCLTHGAIFNPTTTGVTISWNWCALVNAVNGVVMAVSAEQSAAPTSGTVYEYTWSAATIIAPGFYYITLATKWTTQPTFTGIATLAREVQYNLTGVNPYFYRFSTYSVVPTSTPPTLNSVLITGGSFTAATSAIFSGLI